MRPLRDLKSEMDTAFATVQSAIAQHAVGDNDASIRAGECVTRIAALVHEAIGETGRSETDKRLLEAKLRALTEAASRIPRH
jgi:hypothetical protein